VDTLLVCDRTHKAEAIKQMLNLGAEYYCVGIGDGLSGRGFDRVLVILPVIELKSYEVEWCHDYLPLKLFPGGKIMYLN